MPSFSEMTWNAPLVLMLMVLSQNMEVVFVVVRVIGYISGDLTLLETEMVGNWILMFSEKCV